MQNVAEAGDGEYLHHCFIYVAQSHAALLIHALLGSEQHPQSRRGNIRKSRQIQRQLGNIPEIFLQRRLQLRRGQGIQAAGKGNGELSGSLFI